MGKSTFKINSFLTSDKKDVFAQLSSLIPKATELARASISSFRVGAVALGKSRTAYLGANQEFPGLPLNFTIHAEQAAVVNARLHGEKGLLALAVSAAPCGHCRQFLSEIGNPALDIAAGNDILPLAELLPNSFSLPTGGETLFSRSDIMARAGSLSSPEDAARLMADASFSPYTHTKCGIVLVDDAGKIFSGCLLECSAYNPSLSAFQTAMITHALSGGGAISEVYLYEKGPSPIKLLLANLLKAAAPNSKLHVLC